MASKIILKKWKTKYGFSESLVHRVNITSFPFAIYNIIPQSGTVVVNMKGDIFNKKPDGCEKFH